MTSKPSSWQEADAVLTKTLFPRHDRQPFRDRLGYEHAVEWVVMVTGEPPSCDAMGDGYRQRRKASRLKSSQGGSDPSTRPERFRS
ncbi:MAG: hypothetical protein ACR2MP_18540 [Streptosporangiaceae bacterium]